LALYCTILDEMWIWKTKWEPKMILLFKKAILGCYSIRFHFPKNIHMNENSKRDLKLNWQPRLFLSQISTFEMCGNCLILKYSCNLFLADYRLAALLDVIDIRSKDLTWESHHSTTKSQLIISRYSLELEAMMISNYLKMQNKYSVILIIQ